MEKTQDLYLTEINESHFCLLSLVIGIGKNVQIIVLLNF